MIYHRLNLALITLASGVIISLLLLFFKVSSAQEIRLVTSTPMTASERLDKVQFDRFDMLATELDSLRDLILKQCR